MFVSISLVRRAAGAAALAACATLALPALADTPKGAAVSVHGVARDAGGEPLGGVTIVLRGGGSTQRVTTAADGRYTIAGVMPGTYRVEAARSGYAPAHESAVVAADTSLDVTLDADTFSSIAVIGRTGAATGASHFNPTAAAVALIPQSTFVDQGQIEVARVLDQTPGIVTGHAASAFPGSSGASPVALVSPSIRGGLPWETATLVDGHPVAVQGDGFYWLQSLNAFALGSIEVTKGPGASPVVDNDAINGSINFRTLDPTAKPTAALTFGVDTYGGTFTNVLSRGTTSNGKLGWVLEYSVDGSPGPLRNAQVPIVTNLGTSPAGQTINGYPIAANPYSAASPAPGVQNSYQGSKTSLIACCESLNSAYTSKTELFKLRYAFSDASVLTASYFGNQLYTLRDGYGTDALATTFAPGKGYTGALAAGPAIVSTGSYFPPNEYLSNDEPMFDVEFRTTRKDDTILARVYTDSLNVDLANGLSSPNQTYAGVFPSVSGTITTTKCPPGQKTCTVAFDGGPATIVLPGQFNTTPIATHLGGGSFEYDHVAGPNTYGLSIDDSTSAASWIKTSASYPAIGAAFLVPTANDVIPPGASEQQRTYLLRGSFALAPGLDATLSNYYNSYTNTFFTTQNAAGFPEAPATRSFSHDDPRLGLTDRVDPDLALRASLGSSTAPPFLQLYTVSTSPTLTTAGVIYTPGTTTYTQFANNAGLRPETAFGYDVGADLRLRRDPATVLSVDGYLNNLRDQFFEAIIDTKTTFTPATGATGELFTTQYQNLSKARYEGVEVSLRRDPRRGFGFVAQGALQHAYPYDLPPGFYGSNGAAIANLGVVAGHNFVASNSNGQTGGFNATAINTSSISIPYSQGYGELNYAFANGARASLGATYYGPNNSYQVPAFFVGNATLRAALDGNTTVQFSVDNLFDAYGGLFITANGGVAVPLANGSTGVENANAVGPRTFRAFITRRLGA